MGFLLWNLITNSFFFGGGEPHSCCFRSQQSLERSLWISLRKRSSLWIPTCLHSLGTMFNSIAPCCPWWVRLEWTHMYLLLSYSHFYTSMELKAANRGGLPSRSQGEVSHPGTDQINTCFAPATWLHHIRSYAGTYPCFSPAVCSAILCVHS